MKYRQIITFMLLGLFLNGCSTYRNYERPVDIRTDGLYGGEMTDSASLGSLSWRDLFTDPALQVLIEEGLANNTDLRMAELQITEAEAALKAARLAFLPNLSLSPQGGLGGFAWNGTPRTYTLPAMATWQVDVFGSLRNANKRTQMQLEQSRAYRQAVQAHLISSIANYYYTLAMLDAQLKVSEETAESWKQGVEMTKALMEVGEETDAAVSQSEANYYDVCTQIVEIKRQIREVENGFPLCLAELLTVFGGVHLPIGNSLILFLWVSQYNFCPGVLMSGRRNKRLQRRSMPQERPGRHLIPLLPSLVCWAGVTTTGWSIPVTGSGRHWPH